MRTTVSEVKFNGLVLRVEDSANVANEVWLPREEWSSKLSDWESDIQTFESGYELDVVPLHRYVEGRLVVSRKNVSVKEINDSLLNHIGGIVRDMRIVEVARSLIRGTIGNDTPALVTYQNYQSYLDWVSSKELTQELSDHAVLGKGDVIRGFVKGISDKYGDDPASIIIDVSEYLDYRDREIADIVSHDDPGTSKEREESKSAPKKIQPENVLKISPVLLVDDNECRDSIAKILRHEGIEVDTLKNVREARDLLNDLSSNRPLKSNYKLAILDPNLEEHSTDLVGIEIAAKLRSKTKCRVILMTGEVKNSTKLERWPNLGIHGYIEKPFTMEQLIDEIEDAVGLQNSLPLSKWISPEVKSLPSSKKNNNSVSTYNPSEISMEEAIQRLAQSKPGTVIHVFELHPRSFRARSLSSYSGDALKWIPLRGKIAKSVIKDTAVIGHPIIHNDVNQQQQLHMWTLQMMKYQSFCGMPVQVKGKRSAMVAFHPEKNAFDSNFVMLASITAEKVGRAIERKMLYDTRRNEAELASFGMALASLAHELASDMTALDANLKDLGVLASGGLEDISKQSEALETLALIRGDVDVISTKTRILRRTHTSSDRVSIIDCLKKAATACQTVAGETINYPERITIKAVEAPDGAWDVNASMASLIIVFFNLYLNAAQQIDIASSIRRHGLIWNSITRFKDAKGKEWARIRIHDTGPGIHYDDWERIFEPGYSTKPNGSGLGLYICRYLLQDIPQATLSVTSSAIWEGTTVSVNLPLI
jgi:signal transduction histidine kinase/DNA-binding response OmpR family regulator